MNKKPEDVKIITCHLGNGASITAVKGGKSINTSMGFTPLAGVMMGTRCGDIDPAIVTFLMKNLGMGVQEVEDLMNKKSGMLGVSGISSDARDIEDACKAGNENAILTTDVYVNRILNVVGIQAIEKPFDVLLPVGISFYTFQALSYTVDVYRGQLKAEKNILKYALFVSFFPQLVAGPIERSTNLMKQV